MDSLSSGPVAEVLKRLHREAEAADAPLMQTYASEMTNVEQAMRQVVEAETEDLTGLYHGYADNFLSVSPEFGRFLYMCARSCKARRIVEFGSSMGISAIYLAAALRDMGGGCLIGTDLEPSKAERARVNVTAAGLDDLVEFRIGDARETLNPTWAATSTW
jgi:predicted O-methyltransferase YrrM